MPLALDADISVTAPPRNDGAVVHRFDGEAGQVLSWGRELPADAANWPTVLVYGPDAVSVAASPGQVFTLNATGRHTVAVSTEGSFSGTFTLRFNNALPPQDLALVDGRTAVSGTLALGEVRRWRFPLDDGEVFALALRTPTMAGLSAQAGTSSTGAASVTALSGTPFSAQSAPVCAAGAGVRELRLGLAEPGAGRTRGEFTLEVVRPLPLPAQRGQAISGTLAPRELRAWRFDVPEPGYHLLRTVFPLFNGEAFRGVVWGSTAAFANYDGDLRAGALTGESEAIAPLRAGANTLTLDRGNASPFVDPADNPGAFSLVLVPLPTPEVIVPGEAAQTRALQAPGERRYHRFEATQGQSYTVSVQAGFAGTLRVYKLAPNGNHTSVGTNLLPDSPQALVAGQTRTAGFTIPGTLPSGAVFGSGTYLIEVDAAGDATGPYTVQPATP